jgi:hypothetical protein
MPSVHAKVYTLETSNSKSLPRWILNLLLVFAGCAFAGLLLLLLLTVFPQYRPGYVTFTVSQGDIFFHQAKWVAPPNNPDEILATYPISWDAEGFRIPARQAEQYPILVIGDSFTEAPNAARPWPDVLAEAAGIPVRNLAYRGFGPVDEAEMLRLYGTNSGAETVVIGYFEGNDLSDALTASQRGVVLPKDVEDRRLIATNMDEITERDIRYPMQVTLNGVQQDIAFFEPYAWILNAGRDALRRSSNLQVTMQAYNEMQAAMPDACMIVAYFPTKPHIYLPYLDAEDRPVLMNKVERFEANEGAPLVNSLHLETTFEDLLNRADNQRDVIQEAMEEAGFVFFDLTPVLAEAAAQGEMLYYVYDTHWNQAGHNLVGTAIADFLRSDPCNQVTS